jgi:hypothetical protein
MVIKNKINMFVGALTFLIYLLLVLILDKKKQ